MAIKSFGTRKGRRRKLAGKAPEKMKKACAMLRETLRDGVQSYKMGEEYAAETFKDLAKAEGIVAGLRKTYGAYTCGPNTMERLRQFQRAVERKYA